MDTSEKYKHLEEKMRELQKQYEEEHCEFTNISNLAEDALHYSLYCMKDCHMKVVIYSLAKLVLDYDGELGNNE